MDSVTHVLIGVCTYYVLPVRYRTTKLLLASVLLASLPDIDVFFAYTPELYLRWHRGITHSILFALLVPIILSWCMQRYIVRHNTLWTWWKTYFYTCILLYTHIYYDVLTSYGTMVFLPFSAERISFPAIFIIDAFLLMLLIFAIACGIMRKTQWVRTTALIIILYPLCSFAVGTSISYFIAQRYKPLLGANSTVSVYPDIFAPLYWYVVIEDTATYYTTQLNSITKQISFLAKYDKLNAKILEQLVGTNQFFKTYTEFSKDIAIISDTENKLVLAPIRFTAIQNNETLSTTTPFAITLELGNNAITSVNTFASAFPWVYTNTKIPITPPIPYTKQ